MLNNGRTRLQPSWPLDLESAERETFDAPAAAFAEAVVGPPWVHEHCGWGPMIACKRDNMLEGASGA